MALKNNQKKVVRKKKNLTFPSEKSSQLKGNQTRNMKIKHEVSDAVTEINKTLSSIAEKGVIKSNIKNTINNKIERNKIQGRKKTPYSLNIKPNTIPQESSEESIQSISEEINEEIKDFDEKTTINYLQNIFKSIELENKELKEINKLQEEELKKTNSGVNCDILQQYFGLKIESINENSGHIFTFSFDNKLFSFSLKTDSDNSDSYHYTFIKSSNLNISEPLRKGIGITFKKRIVIRFFNEVFLTLAKV